MVLLHNCLNEVCGPLKRPSYWEGLSGRKGICTRAIAPGRHLSQIANEASGLAGVNPVEPATEAAAPREAQMQFEHIQ